MNHLATRLTLWSMASIIVAIMFLGSTLIWDLGAQLGFEALHSAQSLARQTALLASSPSQQSQHLSPSDPGMVAAVAGRHHAFLQVSQYDQIATTSINLSHPLPIRTPRTKLLAWGAVPLWGIALPITTAPDGPAVWASAPIVNHGVVVGHVEAAISLQPALTTIDTVGQGLIEVGLAIIVSLAAVIAFVTYRSYARVQRLTRVLHHISSGQDLVRRVDLTGPQDEVLTLSQAFNVMLDRLQESFARQELVVAQASHQLRTPLASVMGYVSMLRRWGLTNPQLVRESLDVMESQLDRLNNTLETILRLAGIEGREDLRSHTDNLSQFFERWASRQQSPVAITGGPVVCVVWDRDMFMEVFDILLLNTLAHAHPAQAHISWAREDAGHLVIQFHDDGPGFPPDLLPYLFHPFAKHSNSPGAGLGLALARAIVERHGGTIRAINLLPQGAGIVITLPSQMLSSNCQDTVSPTSPS